MAYTDKTAVKRYLGITETTDDTLIDELIVRAQAMIDSYCRQTFEAAADSTRYFDPTRDVEGRTLYLDAPLAAITTVTNGDSAVLTTSDYAVEPRNNTPYRSLTLKNSATASWKYTTTPENAISILGKWAYSTSAPADIVHACVRLTAYLYRQKNNSTDLDRPVSISSTAMLLPADLPKDLMRILAPYRRLI